MSGAGAISIVTGGSVMADGNVSGSADGISIAGGSASDTVTTGGRVSCAVGFELNGGAIASTTAACNGIQIDAATLAIGDADDTINGAIASAGALNLTKRGAIATGVSITGAGAVTQAGTGTTLSGSIVSIGNTATLGTDAAASTPRRARAAAARPYRATTSRVSAVAYSILPGPTQSAASTARRTSA